MRYGVPYTGSKNSIAEWVVENLPYGEVFIDLFAGGCAVTHAAMVSGKYKKFVANDRLDTPDVFLSAIKGEFDGFSTAPTREEFMASDDDALKLLYSFGNNRENYLWSKELEPVKVSASRMLSAPSIHERRMSYKKFMRELSAYIERDGSLERLERLQGLQGLERLERLQGLQGLERLEVKHLDYRCVEIPDDAIVYADPPYRGTNCRSYKDSFDFEAFDSWLAIVPHPVIVSEYTAPKGCVEIAAKEKIVLLDNQNKAGKKLEKLFIQERFTDRYNEQMRELTLF